jgi:hypothetical protein
MKMAVFLLLLTMTFASSSSQRQAGWKGLVPLRSTRADVERVLGASKGECRCMYETPEAAIHVEYAVDRCKGAVRGWNVPIDTVLRLTVRRTEDQLFSDLRLDVTNYRVRRDDTFTTYYANQQAGIEYAVSSNGRISSISYVPSTEDARLRCSGFSPQDGSFQNHMRFDEYGKLAFDKETARLDSFAIMLDQQPDLMAYVIVYAGKVSCLREARLRAERAKNYLVKKRGLANNRIVSIDGGYRENLTVELYALPGGVGPPDVVSTVSTRDVRLLRTRRCADLKAMPLPGNK